ncbi:MAG: histidine kinase, partial [Mycoplasmataceae bacterium]|nr:histidine kinase [Mycoplasmataceae bacterium]
SNKKKIKQFFIVVAVLTSLFIVGISRKSFLNYEKNIIMQQQEQLLTISKLVARGLLDFTEEQINKVNYLGENIKEDIKNGTENQDKILEVFSRVNRDQILMVEYIDFENNSKDKYPKTIEEPLVLKSKDEFKEKMKSYREVNGSYIGGSYEVSKNSYTFDILKPVYIEGNLIGVIITRLGINKMYDLIAKLIKVGKYGYVMVKNSEGIIIMHPLREQVGYDVLVDRKKKYPDLDYSELEELVEMQLSGEEGSYIYHSYWWPQKKLEKVKKFQSFTSVNITERFWIVAVTTSYDEVAGAIRKYLQDITIAALTLISIITTAFFIILRMISTEEAHRVEVNYLKDINESSESLRKKEIELHKKKKLETIGTLTGGIAHEFNNILTPIMGYSEMILMDLKLEDENYDEVKEINNLSKKARDIIDEILKFSENKNAKTKYKFLEVEKVVERSLKLFETLMPLNIRIKKNISPNLGSVYANESQLYQVIIDLCISTYRSMEQDDR